MQSLLVFTARSHEDFFSWHWSPWLESPVLVLGPLPPQGNPNAENKTEISLQFLKRYTEGVGPAHFVSLSLLPVSTWLHLYVLSYRTSVHLNDVLNDGRPVI